jgi:hypothetical protein
MVLIKKAKKREATAPVLDLPVAKVKIIETELQAEPREIETNSGETFTSEPNLNTLIEVVDDFADGECDGVRFYERFRLKQDGDGEWELRDGTKLGALAKARYGNDFFESDVEFSAADFEGFVFQARVQPKTNFKTGQTIGSTLNWETIVAVPKPKKATKTGSRDAQESDRKMQARNKVETEESPDSGDSPEPPDFSELADS